VVHDDHASHDEGGEEDGSDNVADELVVHGVASFVFYQASTGSVLCQFHFTGVSPRSCFSFCFVVGYVYLIERFTHMSSFTEADYPKLLGLLEFKKTITLDCSQPFGSGDDDDSHFVNLWLDDDGYIWGNFDCGWLKSQDVDEDARQKRYQKRFRSFVQDDGEIGLEFTYLPAIPLLDYYDEDDWEKHARRVFDMTRLSEVMSFEDFARDVKNEASWVDDLSGVGGETYALVFDVVPAGRRSVIVEEFDGILSKPLWIQYKGKKYNIHVGVTQD